MACDCYVSLHRSEGFGLTMAEAMQCGKPVIATGYSGNVDFMTSETSYLVPYRLITIDRTHGPYRAGYHWAQPDLDSATDMMRQVEKDRDASRAVGAAAQRHIWQTLHPRTIAQTMRGRLEEIGFGHYLTEPIPGDNEHSAASAGPSRAGNAALHAQTDTVMRP